MNHNIRYLIYIILWLYVRPFEPLRKVYYRQLEVPSLGHQATTREKKLTERTSLQQKIGFKHKRFEYTVALRY